MSSPASLLLFADMKPFADMHVSAEMPPLAHMKPFAPVPAPAFPPLAAGAPAPAISVILAVHNGLPYLAQALDSLISQDFTDWELLAVDDGSTDGTLELLQTYARRDARIRCASHSPKRGQPYCRNLAMAAARGRYWALLDADDAMLPGRLRRQAAYLDRHPRVVVLGSRVREMDAQGHFTRLPGQPLRPRALHAALVFTCPLVHPSCMLRAAFFRDKGLVYNQDFPRAQDYELWSRVTDIPTQAGAALLANLPARLTAYRRWGAQISSAQHADQDRAAEQVIRRMLDRAGLKLSPEDPAWEGLLARHLCLAGRRGLPPDLRPRDILDWAVTLVEANRRQGRIPRAALVRETLLRLLRFRLHVPGHHFFKLCAFQLRAHLRLRSLRFPYFSLPGRRTRGGSGNIQ